MMSVPEEETNTVVQNLLGLDENFWRIDFSVISVDKNT